MSLARVTTFVNKHQFELMIIFVELVACLLVAFLLVGLLLSTGQRVWAAGRPTPRRPVKLVTFPPSQFDRSAATPAEIYISVTEFQTATLRSDPAQQGLDTFPGEGAGLSTLDMPLLDWPVQGTVSQSFGCSPYYTGIVGAGCSADQPWFHDGIDLAAPSGIPVRAALTGAVVFAGPDGDGPACGQYRGYGLGVVVEDGTGWQVLYAHLSEINVTVGQLVTPDTLIGKVGETGCVSGPHLHLGLRRDGQLVDPAAYLD